MREAIEMMLQSVSDARDARRERREARRETRGTRRPPRIRRRPRRATYVPVGIMVRAHLNRIAH